MRTATTTRQPWLRRGVTLTASCAVALSLSSTAPARAETGEAALAVLDNAVRATYAAAARGIDVEQSIPFTRPYGLQALDPRTGTPWATVLMLLTFKREQAYQAGLSRQTALIGVSPDDLLDDSMVTEPSRAAVDALLPPYSGSSDEGWSSVETFPQADGTTIIRGFINANVPASNGEDACRRPLVEVTVGPDLVVRSSQWRETCPRGGPVPSGTRTFRVEATYGPVTPKGPSGRIDPPPACPDASASHLAHQVPRA